MSDEIKNNNEVIAEPESTGGNQGNENDRTVKKYSDEDLDRIMAGRLARERTKAQKLSDEEHRISELDEREKKVLMRELKADAKDALTNKNLPVELVELLNYTDKESLDKSIDTVEIIFNGAIAHALALAEKKRATGVTPKGIDHSTDTDAAISKAFRP